MSSLDKELKYIKLKDLLFVILYAVIISTLLGVVIGIVDSFLSSSIGFSFSMIMYFISAIFIGNQVRKQYDYPHIVYTVITGVFLVVQALIIYALPIAYQVVQLNNLSPLNVFDLSLLWNSIIYRFTASSSLFSLLYPLFIAVGIYQGVRRTY